MALVTRWAHSGRSAMSRSARKVTQQAWFFQTSPERRSTLPTPAVSAAALKGSATMKPAIDRPARADTISAGGSTTRLTSLRARFASRVLVTGTRPLAWRICCSSTLWIEYQNGIASVLPPSSATLLMPGATVSAEPFTWFHATTLAGKRVP